MKPYTKLKIVSYIFRAVIVAMLALFLYLMIEAHADGENLAVVIIAIVSGLFLMSMGVHIYCFNEDYWNMVEMEKHIAYISRREADWAKDLAWLSVLQTIEKDVQEKSKKQTVKGGKKK